MVGFTLPIVMMVITAGERLLAVGQNFWLSIWTDSTVAAEVHHSRLDNRSYIAWYLVLGSVSIMLQVWTPSAVPTAHSECVLCSLVIAVSNHCFCLNFICLASAHNLQSGRATVCSSASHVESAVCRLPGCCCWSRDPSLPRSGCMQTCKLPAAASTRRFGTLEDDSLEDCSLEIISAREAECWCLHSRSEASPCYRLEKVVRLPLSFFSSQPTGRLLNRFARDTEAGGALLISAPTSMASRLTCRGGLVTRRDMLIVCMGACS